MSDLPAGFKLDDVPSGYVLDDLPSGFKLDSPEESPLLPATGRIEELPEAGKQYLAPKKTSVLEDNINAYRELLGMKSAAQSTIVGAAAFPAGMAVGLVDKAMGSPERADPLIGKRIEQFQRFLDQNNPHPESADKYNAAIGEVINRVGVPLMGLHLGVPQPLRQKPVEPVDPKVDVNVLKTEEPPVPPSNRPAPGSPEWVDNQLRRRTELDKAERAMPDPNFEQAHLPFDEPPEGFRHPTSLVGEGMGRLDENGIPINAGRSLEAQHLQDPLQRNLWGDELPRQHPQEAPRGLTEAIDRMPNPPWEGSERDTALGRLKHSMESEELTRAVTESFERKFTKDTADPGITPAGGIKVPRGQRGGFDFEILPRAFREFVENWHQAGGNFSHTGISRMLDDHPVKLNSEQRRTLVALYPDVAKTYQDRIDRAWEQNDEAKARRYGKRFDDALIAESVVNHYDAFGKGFKLDGPRYDAKTGPYAGKVAAQEAADAALNVARRVVPRSQRGGINLKDIEEGIKRLAGKEDSGTMKNMPLAQGTRPDLPDHPTTPASIAKKQQLRDKLEASSLLRKLAPEYSSVTTPEEAIALSKDSKDINYNPVRDATISGINGQVFNNKTNPVLNFVRYAIQEWKNAATKFSKDYVTSKDGVATLLGKLTENEKIQAMETLMDAAKAQIEINAENIGKLGLPEKVNKFILSVRKALDAQWEMAADSLQMAGRDAFKPRSGYLPSIFSGSYKSLVGVMKDGVFSTRAMAQADTRWGHKQAVEAFKKQLEAKGETPVVVPLKRQGMHKAGRGNSMFNGFNDIINTIAKEDPRFAELQLAAQMKANEAAHKLRQFDVHELHKKGISGFVGDSPTRTRAQNAHDLGKAIIGFLEEGADYYAAQKALNDINKVVTSPETAHLTNTREVVQKHIKHVLGQDLNPVGNAVNYAVDLPFRALGISHKIPLAAARGLRTAVGLHMMGIWNPVFTGLQLTQVLTSAWPRMIDLAGKLDMHSEANKSATTIPLQISVLANSYRLGKAAPDFIPQHLKDAFQYAIDNGITTFSELEVATSATRNKKIVGAEKLAAIPIMLGERLTRAPVFMTFADIFHKFGLENQEAFMAAQHATNMAMGDYHAHERPQIYSQLGVLGEFGGALTTFKHNALTNYWTQGKNAISPDLNGNRHMLPAVAALAGVAFFQGISGAPGYAEADMIYQWATSLMGKRQSITESALQTAPDWSKYGILSASTGFDFQSRASMANILPELEAGSLSPQLSVLADMGMKLYDYNKYRDQQSFNDLMKSVTPSGMKGVTEQALMMNEQGQVLNSGGELMFTQPRSEREQTARNMFALRPLRERVEQEDVYTRSKGLNEREKALTDIAIRYRKAVAAGNAVSMKRLSEAYEAKGGDPSTLNNPEQLMEQVYRSGQNQRDRASGKLEPNRRSVERWNEMHPQK